MMYTKPKCSRNEVLAMPRSVTPKFEPPVYIPGMVESGVKPGAVSGPNRFNWRLELLAQPSKRNLGKKYVFVPPSGVESGVSPSTLKMRRTPARLEHLSCPLIRYLEENQKSYGLDQKFMKKLGKCMDKSWNCLYNTYRRQIFEREKTKRKSRLGTKVPGKSDKQLMEEKWKRIKAWVAVKAKPKKVFLPPPPPPKKIVNLKQIMAHMFRMAEPRFVSKRYRRPSIDSQYRDPNAVSKAAQTYKPSERVLKLSKNPAYKLIKWPEIIPGKVNKNCLFDKVPPRFFELAVPKKRAEMVDSDVKENPFSVSPNAMKYKPSQRIIDLSKPIER